jgi:hypothetical protein
MDLWTRVFFWGHLYNRESGTYITKYINFPSYIPNLTSVKDNLKIYNKLMFFKTSPERTRKMLFNFRFTRVLNWPTPAKKPQLTHERVEYNVFLFDMSLKGCKSLKIFKISLRFRFDK